MSDAISVEGSSLEYSTDGGTNWNNFAEPIGVAVPEISQDYIDVTNLDSTGGFREYIPGLKDAGELTFEFNYTPAMFTALKPLGDNNTLTKWRLTLPLGAGQSTTGDVHTWDAFITPSVAQGQQGEHWKGSVRMRVTGQPTYAAGS